MANILEWNRWPIAARQQPLNSDNVRRSKKFAARTGGYARRVSVKRERTVARSLAGQSVLRCPLAPEGGKVP